MSDLGEKYETEDIKPDSKYYPKVTLPIRIHPDMVGKEITLKIKAKVIGIYESKERQSAELELKSCLNKAKKQGAAVYIQPWMDTK